MFPFDISIFSCFWEELYNNNSESTFCLFHSAAKCTASAKCTDICANNRKQIPVIEIIIEQQHYIISLWIWGQLNWTELPSKFNRILRLKQAVTASVHWFVFLWFLRHFFLCSTFQVVTHSHSSHVSIWLHALLFFFLFWNEQSILLALELWGLHYNLHVHYKITKVSLPSTAHVWLWVAIFYRHKYAKIKYYIVLAFDIYKAN